MLQQVPRIPLHRAVAAEDGEAARAGDHVALIRGDEAALIQPLHRIGLAHQVLEALRRADCAVAAAIHGVERDPAGGEMAGDAAGRDIDQNDVVVLLQGDDRFAAGIHIHEFRLGVGGRDLREAGEVHAAQPGAIEPGGCHGNDGQVARRQLRDAPLVAPLIALILDHHHHEAPIGAECDRIRLPADFAARLHPPAAEIHDRDMARGGVLGRRGIDHREGAAAQRHDRIRLPLHRQEAGGAGGCGIGDVDEAEAALFSIYIDQQRPILRGGDDLRDRAPPAVAIRRQHADSLDCRETMEDARLLGRSHGGEDECGREGEEADGQRHGEDRNSGVDAAPRRDHPLSAPHRDDPVTVAWHQAAGR